MSHVPLSKWGRDHWSTLVYIETCVDGHDGMIDNRKMRVDREINPHRAHIPLAVEQAIGKRYPTRLFDGSELFGHDDWSCVDDAVAEGLLEWHGSGFFPVFRLTAIGRDACSRARQHRADAKTYDGFDYNPRRVRALGRVFLCGATP